MYFIVRLCYVSQTNLPPQMSQSTKKWYWVSPNSSSTREVGYRIGRRVGDHDKRAHATGIFETGLELHERSHSHSLKRLVGGIRVDHRTKTNGGDRNRGYCRKESRCRKSQAQVLPKYNSVISTVHQSSQTRESVITKECEG